jgi:hypothetical protein
MKRGAVRTMIPVAYKDLTLWAGPEPTVLADEVQKAYAARRGAVEGYAAGLAFDDIKTLTGKGRSEVKRLIQRCLALGPDGQIVGFWALVPGWRIKGYTRTKVINHARGSGSGGCAGALTALFEQYPEVQSLVRDMYLGRRKNDVLPEARMTIREIHDEFKRQLRLLRFTDAQWPFNTKNCGYKSIAAYLDELRNAHSRATVAARSGAEAARRFSVGNGFAPLIPVLRPYSFAQLDYHKVDSASVIILKNDHGASFEVPLARWHFGLIVEELSGAVTGFAIVLALNPSGDDALEVIQNAVLPTTETDLDVQLAEGNSVVIHQIIPELKHQCFAVLKVDNAWANAANSVVNNIIATIGCAVNFGPAYAWWRRPLIERIFGALTRRGLQRLPSTFGSGPSDTKVSDPQGAAASFRIELSELVRLFKRCIREHNHKDSEGLQYISPVKRLQLALATPASGLFPQPLPAAVQKHSPLMMHIEEVTVLGDRDKGVRPYFNLARHRHTNEQLANSFRLIDKKLIVYVDRMQANRVFAAVKETGEQLGQMKLYGPWANSCASWRERQNIIRSGMSASYHREGDDPVRVQREEKEAQLAQMSNRERKRSARTAHEVEKARRQEQQGPAPKPETPTKPAATPARKRPDPIGLTDIPDISFVVKGH